MKIYNVTATILELYNSVEKEEKSLFVLGDDEDINEFTKELYSPNIVLSMESSEVKNLKVSSTLIKSRAQNILNGN